MSNLERINKAKDIIEKAARSREAYSVLSAIVSAKVSGWNSVEENKALFEHIHECARYVDGFSLIIKDQENLIETLKKI